VAAIKIGSTRTGLTSHNSSFNLASHPQGTVSITWTAKGGQRSESFVLKDPSRSNDTMFPDGRWPVRSAISSRPVFLDISRAFHLKKSQKRSDAGG
jgi:hypothetical protein